MGSCNCKEGKPEVGAATIDAHIKKVSDLYSETEPTKFSITPIKVQALFKGYICRSSYKNSQLSDSFVQFYKSLPEFYPDLAKVYHFIREGLFEGELKDGVPNGLGRLKTTNCIKEGLWANGKLNGLCRVVQNSEVFIGVFKDNVKEGYGECFGVNIFKGNYQNNVQNGKGVEIWKDGSRYEGLYVKGVRTGKGVFVWADGSRYDGLFRNNTLEGFGKYFSATGRKYEGEWKNNLMHGTGKFWWTDGKVYEGQYRNNKKNGFGVLIFSPEKRYEGEWRVGKPHGIGTLYNEGSVKYGIWKAGKYC